MGCDTGLKPRKKIQTSSNENVNYQKEEKIMSRLETNEVLDFNNKLNNFNGDFEKLWKN